MPKRWMDLRAAMALSAAALAGGLTACAPADRYEAAVENWDPIYCYKSLAGARCYAEPKASDAGLLVNYYGPSPRRYPAPPPLPEPNFKAPQMINYWVKDPEPIPRAAPKGDLADRPWLTEDGRAEQAADADMRALQGSNAGTLALLRKIADGAAGANAEPPPVDAETPPDAAQ